MHGSPTVCCKCRTNIQTEVETVCDLHLVLYSEKTLVLYSAEEYRALRHLKCGADWNLSLPESELARQSWTTISNHCKWAKGRMYCRTFSCFHWCSCFRMSHLKWMMLRLFRSLVNIHISYQKICYGSFLHKERKNNHLSIYIYIYICK